MNTPFKIIKEFGLEYYFEKIITLNPSNTAPYHNLHHTLTVLTHCYNISQEYIELTYNQRKNLLIAALFHDWGHSQGEFVDSQNIEIALDAFQKYCQEDLDSEFEIVRLIQATEYPAKLSEGDYDLLQTIIREADKLQICSEGYFQHIIFGYFLQEMNVLNLFESLKAERIYVEKATFATQYGFQLFEKHRINILEDLDFCISLLGEKISKKIEL